MTNDGSKWTSHRRYLYLLAKLLFFALIVGGFYWVTDRLGDVVLPVAAGFVLAYLLSPLVDWAEAKGVNRTLSIVVILLLGLGTVTLFIVIITPTLIDEFGILYQKKLPNMGEKLMAWYERTQVSLKERTGYELPHSMEETFSAYGQKILEAVSSSVKEILQRVTTVTTGLVTGTWAVIASLVEFFLIPLFMFYYLRDFNLIKKDLTELIPLPMRDRVIARARRVDSVVGHWFRGQVTVSTILALMYAFGLVLCGVKLGFVIGLFAGLMSIIPYLGFIVGIGLALLMSLLDDGAGWGQFFGVIAVFTIAHTIEGYIITPKIIGDKVGLSPLMVIIVLLVGAEVFGILGVLLAIPVAAVVRVFLLEVIADYKRSRVFLGEDNYLKLLSEGAGTADAQVREALRQSAEAFLDAPLPMPLSTQELNRLAMRRAMDADSAPSAPPAPAKPDTTEEP